MGEGLAIKAGDHEIRLKWHRLRRRPGDPEFGPARLAEGLALGASMEIDLQALADGAFAVLHDDDLSGETTGRGPVRQASAAELGRLGLKAGGVPMTSADLARRMGACHPAALLQFDMKNRSTEVTGAHLDHLGTLFAPHAGHIIASGADEALIGRLAQVLPGMKLGYDPTDDLAPLGPAAMERRLLACLRHPLRPDMVYLNWELLLEAAAQGLDMVALAHAEGVAVDAWTHAMRDPEAGFQGDEGARFEALVALRPDQVTTDAPLATEAAWRAWLSPGNGAR